MFDYMLLVTIFKQIAKKYDLDTMEKKAILQAIDEFSKMQERKTRNI